MKERSPRQSPGQLEQPSPPTARSAEIDQDSSRSSGNMTSAEEDIRIPRNELVNYIEIDLWSRFQSRLFRLVGVVLTGITLAGVLGVPYYINNEIDSRLNKIQSGFVAKNEDLVLRYKLFMLLEAKYETELNNLRQDIFALIRDLENFVEDLDEKTTTPVDYYQFREIRNDLWRLATAVDFGNTTNPQAELIIFKLEESRRSLVLTSPRRIYVATQFAGKLDTKTISHPILDGTLGGSVSDIRIRMTILESFRNGIARLKKDTIFAGSSELYSEQRSQAELNGLFNDLFLREFNEQLESRQSTFLTEKERDVLDVYADLNSSLRRLN